MARPNLLEANTRTRFDNPLAIIIVRIVLTRTKPTSIKCKTDIRMTIVFTIVELAPSSILLTSLLTRSLKLNHITCKQMLYLFISETMTAKLTLWTNVLTVPNTLETLRCLTLTHNAKLLPHSLTVFRHSDDIVLDKLRYLAQKLISRDLTCRNITHILLNTLSQPNITNMRVGQNLIAHTTIIGHLDTTVLLTQKRTLRSRIRNIAERRHTSSTSTDIIFLKLSFKPLPRRILRTLRRNGQNIRLRMSA